MLLRYIQSESKQRRDVFTWKRSLKRKGCGIEEKNRKGVGRLQVASLRDPLTIERKGRPRDAPPQVLGSRRKRYRNDVELSIGMKKEMHVMHQSFECQGLHRLILIDDIYH
jgi:hypothetical protein